MTERTVLLAKREPGSAPGVQWVVAGEDGAQEVSAAYAEHLLRIDGNDFFIVQPKAETEEKAPATKTLKGKKQEEAPKLETKDDLSEALSVASSTTNDSGE